MISTLKKSTLLFSTLLKMYSCHNEVTTTHCRFPNNVRLSLQNILNA